MVRMACPDVGEEEKKAVCKVIDSGMIASGTVVKEFEKEFASYCGADYGIATTSGTTALEVALRAAGVGPGDKVLTTAFSFIASTNAIIYVGAIPEFLDINKDTFNIDEKKIERKLAGDPSIKAILVVHLYGRPCNMGEVMEIARKYGVRVIEDCAQAHGASIMGKKVGTFGDAAAFSFYPTKNMTTGEGGMVLTNKGEIAERAGLLINHGMKVRYHHEILGYNYRMTNIAAAIGLCQLKKLEENNKKRIRNAKYYLKNIVSNKVILPGWTEGHVYHQFTVRVLDGVRRREELCRHLEENGIGYSIFYPLSIPEQTCYEGYHFIKEYPNTDEIKHEVISLPVHPLLCEKELREVTNAINSF